MPSNLVREGNQGERGRVRVVSTGFPEIFICRVPEFVLIVVVAAAVVVVVVVVIVILVKLVKLIVAVSLLGGATAGMIDRVGFGSINGSFIIRTLFLIILRLWLVCPKRLLELGRDCGRRLDTGGSRDKLLFAR